MPYDGIWPGADDLLLLSHLDDARGVGVDADDEEVEQEAREDDEIRVRAGISGSLTDSVRGSLNVLSADFPGIVYNTFLGKDAQGYDRQGARGKLEIDASDNLEVVLIADYMQADDTGTRGPWVLPNASQAAAIAPIVAGPENRTVYTDVFERVEDENWGLSAQLDWSIGLGTVTSITAYRKWDNTQYQDIDGTAVVYAAVDGNLWWQPLPVEGSGRDVPPARRLTDHGPDHVAQAPHASRAAAR